MKNFLHLKQPDAMDCGATCLAMVAKHYGKNYTIVDALGNLSFEKIIRNVEILRDV